MEPEILHRVIYGKANPEPWQRAPISIKSAVLRGYRRYSVRECDYPAIVADDSGSSNNNNSSSSNGGSTAATTANTWSPSFTKHTSSCILGTVASGLTDGDVQRLDLFEGDEYEKRNVKVRVLREPKETAIEQNTASNEDTSKSVEAHLAQVRRVLDAADEEFADETYEVDAMTYVWIAGLEKLVRDEWDFGLFRKEKLLQWLREDESNW